VRAFHELNGAAGRVTSGLMAEVGEALVATAVGIMVALPAIASYNYFQRVIKARITRADSFGKEVLALLKSEQRLEQPSLKSSHVSGTMRAARHVA
jgi:biopolymer transport protein ExbB